MATISEFWEMADDARLDTEYKSDEKLKYLRSAPPEVLKQVCLQYRYFTKEFPNNLGILISKVPYGNFKSLMGEILSEELGEGVAERSHIQLYDDFLVSISLDEKTFEQSAHPDNVTLIEEIQELTQSQSAEYAIGLCGMGGECLCQVYLSNMHKNLIDNPYIVENQKNIDWRFWDFHTGEADIIHKQKVRQAISEVAELDSSNVDDLVNGYQKAKQNWDKFWDYTYNAAMKEGELIVN